jgi:ATP-dependent helicase HrpA
MIHEKFNVSIPASAWPADSLPDYLKMRFAIVNEKGKEVRSARDIAELRGELSPAGEPAALKKAKKRWEREGITAWDFGELPEAIDLEGGGSAYPALERGDDGRVAIRLFSDRERATAAHREGVAALYELSVKKEIAFLKKSLALPQDLYEAARACGGIKHIEQTLYRKVMRLLFGRDIRSKEAFDDYAKTARQTLFPRAQELLRGIIPVIRAGGNADRTFRRLESGNRSNRAAQNFISALRTDLGCLLPEDFVELYDDERLKDVPRYLQALEIRAERGITHLDKDAAKAEKVRPFTERLEGLREEIVSPSEERKRALEQYQWMVEEYKISVFAPEMKTARPVSPKRLQEKIGEIERMF